MPPTAGLDNTARQWALALLWHF